MGRERKRSNATLNSPDIVDLMRSSYLSFSGRSFGGVIRFSCHVLLFLFFMKWNRLTSWIFLSLGEVHKSSEVQLLRWHAWKEDRRGFLWGSDVRVSLIRRRYICNEGCLWISMITIENWRVEKWSLLVAVRWILWLSTGLLLNSPPAHLCLASIQASALILQISQSLAFMYLLFPLRLVHQAVMCSSSTSTWCNCFFSDRGTVGGW
jgi:hypothetical protein